jgi:hypothetical protein
MKIILISLTTCFFAFLCSCNFSITGNNFIIPNKVIVHEKNGNVFSDEKPIKSSNNLINENMPNIFYFISNSHYVVRAKLKQINIIGKRIKENSKEGVWSISDEVGGDLYYFESEKLLYFKSYTAQESAIQMNDAKEWLIFVPQPERLTELYKAGETYILFLKKDKEKDSIVKTFELDLNKNYFRAFVGEMSIFPSEGGMHPLMKGVVKVTDTRYKELAEKIEVLSEALSEKEVENKIKSLKKLTVSKDTELADNAKYAIEILQAEKVKQKQPQN